MKALFWRLKRKGMEANAPNSTGFLGKGVPRNNICPPFEEVLLPTHEWSKTKKNLLVRQLSSSMGKSSGMGAGPGSSWEMISSRETGVRNAVAAPSL